MAPLDRGKWPASGHSHFSSGKGAPGSHDIGGLLSPRSGVDALKGQKFLGRSSKQESSVIQTAIEVATWIKPSGPTVPLNNGGTYMFQHSWSHLKILGVRREP
jgi:hypothetical protein